MVTEDVIINFLPVFKRLEDVVYLCPGLLKNNILKCFRGQFCMVFKPFVLNIVKCNEKCNEMKSNQQ